MQTRNEPAVPVPGNAQEAANLVRDIHATVGAIRSIAERAEQRAGTLAAADAETRATLATMGEQIVALETANATYQRERLSQSNDPAAIRSQPTQQRAAFEHFLRTGDMSKLNELRGVVRADMNERASTGNTGVGTDGGYLVLPELDAQVDRIARVFSGLRNHATVRVIGAQRYEKRRKLSGTDANWEGEGDGATATDALKWGVIGIDLHQLRSEPEYSLESLEDPFINMEAEIAEDLGEAFGKKEAAAHINGTGAKQPLGLLAAANLETQTTIGGAEVGWNKIGCVETSTSGEWGATNAEGDIFRQIVFYARNEFLNGAGFFMNRKSLSQLVVFKDANKQYIWQPSLRDGTPQSLVGYGVNTIEEMPDKAASAVPVLFGNMAQAALILDRAGMQVLRNPYRTSGQVTFFARKRTGFGLRKGEALKGIKIKA